MCRHSLPAMGWGGPYCPNHPIQLNIHTDICPRTTDWVCRSHILDQRAHFRQLAHIYFRSTEQTPKLASCMLRARNLASIEFIVNKYFSQSWQSSYIKGDSSGNFPDRIKWQINVQQKKGNLNTASTSALKNREQPLYISPDKTLSAGGPFSQRGCKGVREGPVGKR